MFRLVFMAAAIGAWPCLAFADCTAPSSDAERAQCVGQELRNADAEINDIYGQLRARLSAEGQNELRHQEIAWIRLRAQDCQVDLKEPDRDKWIANLLRDFGKTVCVVRFTDRRIAELRAQQAALTGPQAGAPEAVPPPAGSPVPGAVPPAASGTASSLPALVSPAGDIYELDAQRTVARGKWYFEAELDSGEIAKTASATIFIGVKTDPSGAAGTLQTIHKRNIGEQKVNIGMAIDLDDGKFYTRINGAWRTQPGSAAGGDLRLGRPYLAALTSSVPLGPYLGRGLVEVNFGQSGFVYAVPDGYQPLDRAPPRPIVEQ
jgi:uncharacterized protein YecT (DUF1311 family)